MCGLSGIIGFNRGENNGVGIVRNMISTLAHRGPDGHKIVINNNNIYGFSRLAIIDLKKRSMQPMISKDKKYILSFNGEIYNYKELRKEISDKYHFITESDSEVLMAVLILWGLEGLEKVYGMFSFCFYDGKNNRHIFARDRFGQKPLFFSTEGSSFFYASEIKALLAAGISKNINYYSISDYVVDGAIDYGKETFFSNINQLEPGCFLIIDSSSRLKHGRWYNLSKMKPNKLPKQKKELNEYILSTFNEVCAQHYNSDVPVGIALSGGLDSSSLLASSKEFKNDKARNKCFSVEFEGSFSERRWVEESVNYFDYKCEYSEYKIKNFLEDFDNMIYSHEGPLGGLFNCGMENLYRMAVDQKVKVLMDGTGLDEAFGGYRIHHLVYLNRLKLDNNKKFIIELSKYCEKWNVDSKITKKEIENLKKNNKTVQDGTSFDQKSFITDFVKLNYKENKDYKCDFNSSLKEHFLNYINFSKIPKNTRIKDRQSMSYSIELRLPFLDHRIIELGMSMEDDSYFQGGLTKNLIRNAMKDHLPEFVRNGQKRSIQSPQAEWLKHNSVKEMIMDLLSSSSFKNRGIFNQKNVLSSYDEFLKFGANNTFHIWQWINLENFFKIFLDNSFNKFNSFKINIEEEKIR
jgi:asparagine synthase (glutamine-hydrolysing)